MTTYWISNSKHWCKTCRKWCDAKPIQIKKHEEGNKHKEKIVLGIKRKKREKWLKEKEKKKELEELRRIECAAISSFEKDQSQGLIGASKRTRFNQFHLKYEEKISAHRLVVRFACESASEQLERLNNNYGPSDQYSDNIQNISIESKKYNENFSMPIQDEWFYCTPKGDVQGPFKSKQMAQWLKEGWFKKDLKVRNSSDTAYKYLFNIENPFGIDDFCVKNEFEENVPKRKICNEKTEVFNKNLVSNNGVNLRKVEFPSKIYLKDSQISTSFDIDPIIGLPNFSSPQRIKKRIDILGTKNILISREIDSSYDLKRFSYLKSNQIQKRNSYKKERKIDNSLKATKFPITFKKRKFRRQTKHINIM